MSEAIDLSISFRIGARTLFKVRRRLVRIALPLDEAIAGRMPSLPPLPQGADGYSLLSVPVAGEIAADGLILAERQRYRRWYADLTMGRAAYLTQLSGNLRSTLKRKGKRIAATTDGRLDLRRYRTAEELEAFHAVARPLAAATYQEKLMGMGLPGDPGFVAQMREMTAADRVRAWLLYVEDAPAAYLYCPVHDGTLVYEFVGHDERFDALSPGTVLMAEAIGDLQDEGIFDRFDFTEGEGRHKRQFATGHVECRDVFLLHPTLRNRAILSALRRFDAAIAWAKRTTRRGGGEP